MSDPIRIAVVGAGAIAQVAHLPSLRRLPGVEVAAICDNDLSKAQALAARFEVKETFDDIEEVLKYARADAVAICTPNHLHEIHVVSALAAGVHVLCERPLALTVAGVERVLQASEKYGKRVMVGMNHRFRSDVQAVRGFLAGGDIGQLQAIRGGWYTFQPSRQVIGWRLRRQEAGGGAFLDLGLQLLDLGLWLAGWPAAKRVAAHTTGSSKDGVEDLATALVVCENGVSLSIDVSWRHMGGRALLVRPGGDERLGERAAAANFQGDPRQRERRDPDRRERAGDGVRAVLPSRMDVFPGGHQGRRERAAAA